MNFVAMSNSDSDHDSDGGYTSDDSYGRYEVGPLSKGLAEKLHMLLR